MSCRDSACLIFAEIDRIVAGLCKKSVSVSKAELDNLLATWGHECERYLLRTLFATTDFTTDFRGNSKETPQAECFYHIFVDRATRPGFASNVAFGFENPLKSRRVSFQAHQYTVAAVCKTLRLSRVYEVVFALALLHSDRQSIRDKGIEHLRIKFAELLQGFVDPDTSVSTGLVGSSVELVHLIVTSLLQEPKHYSVSSELLESFLSTLRRDFPVERVPAVLAPLLYPSEQDDNWIFSDFFTERSKSSMVDALNLRPIVGSLALQIQEIGYGFCAREICKQNLNALGMQDVTASSVAHVLAMMVRTHSGLKDGMTMAQVPFPDELKDTEIPTWQVDVFVQVLHEKASNLNWSEVVSELDQPGFAVRDRKGLSLLTRALLAGLRDHVFPVALLYRQWNNKDGQISWITQILKNVDIFSLADLPHRKVQYDILKAPPEENDKDIANWRSLDLIETLLQLGDAAGLGNFVRECFQFPKSKCPDLLVLGLLQAQSTLNAMRQELLQLTIPVFYNNHPNSSIVLQYAYNFQSSVMPQLVIRQIIHVSMAEWYMRSLDDQLKLGRLLEISHDLKAISSLLSMPQQYFPFAVDLACLASRRDFLKLDKWLSDKSQEHGEQFVRVCLDYVKRRCPSIFGSTTQNANTQNLPTEILTTMLMVLQSTVNNVSPTLGQEIIQAIQTCRLSLAKATAASQQVTKSATPTAPPVPVASVGSSLFGGLGSDFPNTSVGGGGGGYFGSTLGGFGTASSQPTQGTNAPFSVPPPSIASASPGRQMLQSGLPGGVFGPDAGLMGRPPVNFPAMNPPAATIGSRLPAPPHVGTIGSGAPPPSNAGPVAAPVAVPGAQPSQDSFMEQYSDEIQDEANSYFQQIYAQPPQPTMSIEQFLAVLHRFKSSPTPKEREVFGCMLKNLFEEYKFFPQYPDKELYITALLFGGIVRENLVDRGMYFAFALRAVLEALRKEFKSKMWYFGAVAMDQFKTTMREFPSFCAQITKFPNFAQYPKTLVEYITYGMQSQEPPVANRSDSPVVPPGVQPIAPQKPAAFLPMTVIQKPATSLAAADIGTLVTATENEEKKVSVPPESSIERIAFLFNNLSKANLQQKMEEVKQVLKDEAFYCWLAQYLVMKRVSIEPNFHPLYASFVDAMNKKDFTMLTTNETFRNIRILLRSDKSVTNFSDRTLLKNLGHWLGMLTLGKNRAIKHDDLDVKSLILEAYYKGQQELLFVVPFVAKILESCELSKVFKPPNPWTMAILFTLGELHREPDLRLNLKFEIEVLCKRFDIDVHTLRHTNILKDTEKLANLAQQLSNPQKLEKPTMVQPARSPLPPPASEPAAQPTEEQGAPAPSGAVQPSTTPVPQPKFAYHEINVQNLAGLHQHIVINASLPLFQMNPPLKTLVPRSIERAVSDLLSPVADRALRAAMTVTEHVVKKDFALSPEESRMRLAAQQMVRSLTAGMAMLACREALLMMMQTYLKTQLSSQYRGATPEQQRMIDDAALAVAEDNLEVAQCFIVKSAVERAVPDMERRLATEFDVRRHARAENRRYCDPTALTYQAERMPDAIRLKVGTITAQQAFVYEEFVRNLPGFRHEPESDVLLSGAVTLPEEQQPTKTESEYQKALRDIEGCLSLAGPSAQGIVQAQALQLLRDTLVMACQTPRDTGAALQLVQHIVEGFLEKYHRQATDIEWNDRLHDMYLLVLRGLANLMQPVWLQKQVTRCLMECRTDARFNIDAVDVLIRTGLVNLVNYDIFLAQAMENGLNFQAVSFALQLVRLYFVEQKTEVTEQDFSNTLDVLGRLMAHNKPTGAPGQAGTGAGEGSMANVLDMLRAQGAQMPTVGGGMTPAPSAPTPTNVAALTDLANVLLQSRDTAITPGPGPSSTAAMESYQAPVLPLPGGSVAAPPPNVTLMRQYQEDDPPGLMQRTETILREWVKCYHEILMGTKEQSKVFSAIVALMHQQGILKSDDLITRFFRLCVEMCVDFCYRALRDFGDGSIATMTLNKTRSFYSVDAFVRLIVLLVKHSGDGNQMTKINLLNKVLGIIASVLLQDHEVRKQDFHQAPYQRMLIMLFTELTAPDMTLDNVALQILNSFCTTLHCLQPKAAPGFAFGWLDIIGHRTFMTRVLAQPLHALPKTWAMYAQLIICHMKFLAPFLRNIEMPKAVALVYKGTLRILLVLLHDFPELLCDYHYAMCDVVPANCVQLRNLILSAYPRNMRLPDPFMPNLKVDQLPEIATPPRIYGVNVAQIIKPDELKTDLDNYLKNRAPVSFLSDLRSKLQVSNEPGQKYDTNLMNAVVLYVGIQAITAIQSKEQRPSTTSITHTAHMDIFQNLAVDLDNEGRYLFFNAIANQLRYPNSHTHYFSCTLLYLFAEANQEAIQEQITRILFERLVALRPHPWGLLITFIELIKNPNYHFWKHHFVRCAPEIERLFDTVARSCVARQVQEAP